MGSGSGKGLSFGKTQGAKDDAKAAKRERAMRAHHSKALPGHDRAMIPDEKLSGYSLNPEHPIGGPKARVFKAALDFTAKDSKNLAKQIKSELPYHEAKIGELDSFGQRYSVDLPIVGNNGLTKLVRTGWLVEADTEIVRLVSAFVIGV